MNELQAAIVKAMEALAAVQADLAYAIEELKRDREGKTTRQNCSD
jgi:hypothetical protein